jgi:hypothetical protein
MFVKVLEGLHLPSGHRKLLGIEAKEFEIGAPLVVGGFGLAGKMETHFGSPW